jgi:hypothetical protein
VGPSSGSNRSLYPGVRPNRARRWLLPMRVATLLIAVVLVGAFTARTDAASLHSDAKPVQIAPASPVTSASPGRDPLSSAGDLRPSEFMPFDDAGGESTRDRVLIDQASPGETATVNWAIDRFDATGMHLPDLIITFHDNRESCDGFNGMYQSSSHQVDICNRGGGDIEPRHTVLHELAHAWSLDGISLEAVAEFLTIRKLDAWASPDLAWWQQGREQAAEIVAWGLMDAGRFHSVWIQTEPCSALAQAFQLLTGQEPLHDSTHSCE